MYYFNFIALRYALRCGMLHCPCKNKNSVSCFHVVAWSCRHLISRPLPVFQYFTQLGLSYVFPSYMYSLFLVSWCRLSSAGVESVEWSRAKLLLVSLLSHGGDGVMGTAYQHFVVHKKCYCTLYTVCVFMYYRYMYYNIEQKLKQD